MTLQSRIAWELGEENGTPRADFGADGADLKAIQEYFAREPPKNDRARQIKDAFVAWADGIWWFSDSDMDKARNYRNDYDLANADTATAKAAVQEKIQTGLSTEQMHGQADRRLSSGQLPTAAAIEGKTEMDYAREQAAASPWLTAAILFAVAGLGGGAAALYFAKPLLAGKLAVGGLLGGAAAYGGGAIAKDAAKARNIAKALT